MLVTENPPAAPAVAPASTTDSPRGRGVGGSRFSIGMDVVNSATADLPERQRLALRWMAHHCYTTNQSHRDVAPKLKQPSGETYSHDSLYHALTGGRKTEQLGNIVEAIERFRSVIEERSTVVKTGFIETAISRKIWKNCRRALKRQRVLLIYGESQIGKTISLEEYAKAHNHGETKYLRLPVGCGFGLFLKLLAGVLGVPLYQSEIALRDSIMDAVDEHMLLIIDEMHEAFGADGRSKLGVKVVNFLREIYDRKKCGLVLCGTKVFSEALTLGPFARNLQQICRRAMVPVQLPAVPSPADLALFAEKFGLGAAPDKEVSVKITYADSQGNDRQATITDNPAKLQAQVVRNDGLGRWLLILEEASDNAQERKRALTWGGVLAAHDSFKREASFEEEAAV